MLNKNCLEYLIIYQGFQEITIFLAQNQGNLRANIFFANFCACSAINFRVFAQFLDKICYCKLTVSAQNQTTEGFVKQLHTNKVRFCCSLLVTFSYKIFKLRDKNNKTEIKIEKLKINAQFFKCLNLCVVLNFDIPNVDYFLSNEYD